MTLSASRRTAAVGSCGLFMLLMIGLQPAFAFTIQPEVGASIVIRAKILCAQDGTCVRLPRRRPAAGWVYGDGNFYPSYAGPGYYGNPATRSRWIWWPTF